MSVPLHALAITGLVVAFGVGVWTGYRWAKASRQLEAIIAASVARLDLTPEDEAEKPTPWQQPAHHLLVDNYQDCLWCRRNGKPSCS